MTVRIPDAWQFVLLALAAYRVYRLIARDTITEPLRAAVSYPDTQAVSLDEQPEDEGLTVIGTDTDIPKSWRVYVATLIRCPWCAGFYVSVGTWLLWDVWPRPVLFLATPWAIAAVLGLVKKNLDG